MDASPGHGVYVFSERPDVALELLSVARALAGPAGSFVGALVCGPGANAAAGEHLACGADRVVVLGHPRLDPGRADLMAAAMEQAVERLRPDTLVVGATRSGTETAARLAQRLGAPCAGDCLAVQREDGGLVVEKRCYGGKFVARRMIPGPPRILTIPARRFEAPPRAHGRAGRIEELAVELPAAEVTVIRTEPRKKSGVEIGKAEVVVSVGRGLKRAEDLAIVQELAEVLGGVVGASRPLVAELGWLPPDVQVGLSGTTVKPKLYIACGISGQVEHLVGMRGSTIVVAINTDPQAPIMQEADYCVVADLNEMVPALTRALRRGR